MFDLWCRIVCLEGSGPAGVGVVVVLRGAERAGCGAVSEGV